MFKNKILFSAFIVIIAILGIFSTHNAEAATCTAATGNWNTIGIWDCGHVPLSNDDVVIPTAVNVTVDTAAVANTVLINDPVAASNGLTISGSNSLTISGGALTLTGSSGAGNSTAAVGAGTLSAHGITIADNGSTGDSIVSASTGTITTTNGVTFLGGASNVQLTTTDAATINLVGSTITAGGTVAINAATQLNVSGTSAINGAYTWGKVRVTSGTLTLGAALIAATGLQVDSGAILAAGANLVTDSCTSTGLSGFTINGTISGSGGITLNGIGCTIDGTGTISNTGSFSLNGGVKTISSTAILSFPGTLIFAGVTVTNNGTITATGNVTGQNSTTSVWVQGSNSILNVGSAALGFLFTGRLDASATGNTVNYNRAGDQGVKFPLSSFYNLTLSGSGIKTISGTLTISNDLVIDPGLSPVILGDGSASTVGGGLKLGGSWQSVGSWGSTGSAATNKTDTYFAAANTGIVTNTIRHSSGGSTTVTSGGGGGSTTTTTPPVVTTPPPAQTPLPIPGCEGRNTGFSTTTGASCVGNPIMIIAGCEGRNTGYSTTSGASCVGNTVILPPLPPVSISYDLGTVSLRRGNVNNFVKNLQLWLNSHVNANLEVDGVFGRQTEAQVKVWQASIGLVADGVVGPKSRAKMAGVI